MGSGGKKLEIRAVSHRYGRASRLAVDNVSFSVGAGTTFLVGANGAGKSTIMKCILGDVSPDSGLVFLDEEQFHPKAHLRQIGYTPQTFTLPRHLCVGEYVEYVARLRGFARQEVAQLARDAVDRVGLGSKYNVKVRQLSGGQHRRVGIAVAVMGQPAVLVLDEPTAGLDPVARLGIRELVDELRQDSIVLMSTHQTDDLVHLGGQAIVMVAGRKVFDGSVIDLSRHDTGKFTLGTVVENAIAELSLEVGAQ